MAANDFQKSPTVFQVRNNTAEKQKANTQTNETKEKKNHLVVQLRPFRGARPN